MESINCARGTSKLIDDRFDLSLECIRLWYSGITDNRNPLGSALEANKVFLMFFEDFQSYVKFFLLDDLVDEQYEAIQYWLPFHGFGHSSTYPVTLDEYKIYRENITSFTKARNQRIQQTY
jgi:hypothetical protein